MTIMNHLKEGLAAILAREGAGTDQAGTLDRLEAILSAYTDALFDSSRIYGLISPEDAAHRDTLVVRHILESAAGAPFVADLIRNRRQNNPLTVFDLGSGAGLPGIPLAVVLATALDAAAGKMVLVERKGKRVRFLESVVETLGLSSVEVLADDAERPSRRTLMAFRASPPPIVVFRAYRKMTEPMVRRLVAVFPEGTEIVGWKGKRESARDDAAVIEAVPGVELSGIAELEVPFLDRERTLLYARRV